MKQGDDVTGDVNDHAVRTSVSQDRVTETLCTEELLILSTFEKFSHVVSSNIYYMYIYVGLG
jgi:hypothetical protein